jgi:RecG-like helicase
MHGKADLDPLRRNRFEMVNPEIELVSTSEEGPGDSTEVGRIVPVYEAIGGISSRMLRRIIYAVLRDFDGNVPDPLPEEIRRRYRFPTRREALLDSHFPSKEEGVEQLNTFRSPAQARLILRSFSTTSWRLRCAVCANIAPRVSPCACEKRKCARR